MRDFQYCTQECQNKYFSDHKHEVVCACGTGHKMKPYGFQIVHWNGQHWQIDCLLTKLTHDRKEDRNVITILIGRMKKHQEDMGRMICASPGCGRRVGKSYRLHGDAVYCAHCFHEIGGEG